MKISEDFYWSIININIIMTRQYENDFYQQNRSSSGPQVTLCGLLDTEEDVRMDTALTFIFLLRWDSKESVELLL